MFNFLKKKTHIDNNLYAPTTGEIINLSQVSDPVFAKKTMGDGFGLKPTSDKVVSPVVGTVTMIAPTFHAIGFKMTNGLEVLVHLGVDTVNLKGKPFEVKTKVGKKVRPTDTVMLMDRKQIKNAGLDDVIAVVFTNTKDKLGNLDFHIGSTEASNKIGQVKAK